MKRFWTTTAIEALDDGSVAVLLGGRRARTPRGRALALPTEALARAVAAEWEAADDEVRPGAMPMTGLSNAAIDIIADDPKAFAQTLARYAQGDLLCYRAQGPQPLVERQANHWDPLLRWCERRFDGSLLVTQGILHVGQPDTTLDRIEAAFAAYPPFSLAALSPLVTLSGSAVIALAVAEDGVDVTAAWAASVIDETWQTENWGEEAEALAQRTSRQQQFLEAVRFLRLSGG